MDRYEYVVKVPKDRIAVLIGEKGAKKRELEDDLAIAIDIDSEEGDVRLSGTDTIRLFTAQEIVKAIARGFNPDVARMLLKPECTLELLNITDYTRSRNQILRLKGRVIGESGKARSTIEELSETHISVYGKTIGILGEADAVSAAKRGIDMLLTGAPHSTVFSVLERWRRNKRGKEMAGEQA